MGTNCTPLLAEFFLYSYENELLDNMIRNSHMRLARSFNPKQAGLFRILYSPGGGFRPPPPGVTSLFENQ